MEQQSAGIVSYGSVGGARAEHLRGILGELSVADVRVHPALSLFTDFESGSVFKPADLHLVNLNGMLDRACMERSFENTALISNSRTAFLHLLMRREQFFYFSAFIFLHPFSASISISASSISIIPMPKPRSYSTSIWNISFNPFLPSGVILWLLCLKRVVSNVTRATFLTGHVPMPRPGDGVFHPIQASLCERAAFALNTAQIDLKCLEKSSPFSVTV